MLRGEYEEDHRSLMQASVMRDGHCVFEALAMNDVVVNRGATAGMVELRVEVDGHFVANQRADGLIIATPPAPPPMRCRRAGLCCTRPFRAG
jgi:NAD+ kinase